MSTTTSSTTASSAVSASRRQHAVFHELRVADVERLTDDAVAVTFEVPPELAEAYRFTQGQHLTLRTHVDGADVRRNYSICAPATTGPLRIAVKRLDGGVFSAYACESMKRGDTLEVMTPTGHFFTDLDPAQRKRYVAVAAGSGITPILSIISTVLEVESGSSVCLVYGNRTTASVMFLEELADLKNRYPDRFEMFHLLSREPVEAELLHGRIDGNRLRALVAALVPADAVDEWFLCGPFEMVSEAQQTLTELGVDADTIHSELFHVGDAPPKRVSSGAPSGGAGAGNGRDAGDPASSVTVYLDGRASTFELPAGGQSVLDATLAVRGDAPYACKGGVCGTCRAKLVEGQVEMDRNYALERDELAAGFVLACQSHPTTETLVLDFDQ